MVTSIKVMLNTDRASKSGTYPIIIRVIHKRKKRLIYTKYKTEIEHFDPLTQRLTWSKNNPFSKRKVDEINRDIISSIRNLERAIERLNRKSLDYTIEDIVGRYEQTRANFRFFVFAQKEIEAKESIAKHGTAGLYRSTISSFSRFVVNEELKFTDITYSLLKNYSLHLQAKGVALNTINMYMRNIRAIYNKARKENLYVEKFSPFAELKINTLPTAKRALSKEALRVIATCDLSKDAKLERVRDMFMFSFYTRGMSFVDMVFLRHADISAGVIHYKRNKTQQHLQVQITRKLKSLIDKYRHSSPFILPFLNIEDKRPLYIQYRRALFTANQSLKQIGSITGIETPLTTYVARHLWATIAKNMGGSIAAISEGLGHTTEKTTQIYLKAFDSTIIDSLNEMVTDL